MSDPKAAHSTLFSPACCANSNNYYSRRSQSVLWQEYRDGRIVDEKVMSYADFIRYFKNHFEHDVPDTGFTLCDLYESRIFVSWF